MRELWNVLLSHRTDLGQELFCLLVEGDCQCFKILLVNINYSVNILNNCLHILIDCSQLSKTSYNVPFGSST